MSRTFKSFFGLSVTFKWEDICDLPPQLQHFYQHSEFNLYPVCLTGKRKVYALAHPYFNRDDQLVVELIIDPADNDFLSQSEINRYSRAIAKDIKNNTTIYFF